MWIEFGNAGIEFLAFRPSEIAAAVAMSALGETQVVDIDKDVDCCNHVDKVKSLFHFKLV